MTSQSIPNLDNDTFHRVRVRARSSSGAGIWNFDWGTPSDKSGDATLSDLTASSSTSAGGTYSALALTPSIFPASLSYTAKVANARTHVKLTPTVTDTGKATVKVGKRGSLTRVDSASASDAIALDEGENVIKVRVTAEDGYTVRIYTVTVTRATAVTVNAPPTVSLSVSPNPVREGASVTVTARLSRALSSDVTIPLVVTRDTSESGDHGALSSIRITAGATSGTGTITTARDADADAERFTVALDTANLPSSVAAGSPRSVAVTISEGGTPPTDVTPPTGVTPPGGGGGGVTPPPPTVSLSVSPNPVTEGAGVAVTAALSQALSGEVTIPLVVTRGTSEPGDHGTLSGIVIAAGATTGTGTLSTHRDADPHDETFTVALGTLPSQVAAGSPASVTVAIDDDAVAGAAPAPEVGFFPGVSNTLDGLAWVVNRSASAGTVTVRAFDDAGKAYPAQTLTLGAGFGVGFKPADLEEGNPDKGLTGTGAGAGDWRLVFESDLDLRVLGLVRQPDGGLAPVHHTAPGSARGATRSPSSTPRATGGSRAGCGW